MMNEEYPGISALLNQLRMASSLEELETCARFMQTRWQEWRVLSDSGELIKHLQYHAIHFAKLSEFQTDTHDTPQEEDLIRRVINVIGGTARLLSETLGFHQSMSQVLVELWNALVLQPQLWWMGKQ